MSSLSYNWQNQFSDLRYQVDQLQKTDPEKYAQLAASLGLKPGAKINVPSQYSPEWASMFVQAANLYTPPVHTQEDPTVVPTPTSSPSGSHSDLTVQLITDFSDSASGEEPSASGSDSLAATEGLDTAESNENTSTQYGNPIVGDYNGAESPIVPTGQGYSAATILTPSFTLLSIYAMLQLF
ncbi:hypothetical protein H4R22_001252 [Coemansia sp. RSA 1290]|nr:hypothetical protein H4R22_001252 [Coemansia sp. RSA 1290]KAJ2670249.1 hypothetical protein IWW42_004081 [Coemansia sp. RSA 1085]